MLIKALCDYYDILEKEGNVLAEGYSYVKIHYLVCLTKKGEIDEILPYQDLEEKKNAKGAIMQKLVPRTVVMPERTEKPGIDANIIDHRPLYLFGLNYENEGFTPSDRTGKAKKSHETFVRKNLDFIEGMDTPAVNAYRNFLLRWDPEKETENVHLLKLGKGYGTSGFAFCLTGFPDHLLQEEEQIKEKWERTGQGKNADKEGYVAQCAVSGERDSIARIHQKIKGIYGGLATGSVLIGFNNASESSYGNEQSYNSNISEKAMKKYTEALNYLLGNTRHKMLLDDMTVIFWAMNTGDSYADMIQAMFYGQSDQMDAGQTEEMLKALFRDAGKGKISEGRLELSGRINPDVDFYMAGLKPNSSRLALKFLYRKKYGEVLWNLAKFQKDFQISSAFHTVSLYRIKEALKVPKIKGDTVNSALMAKLFEAALYGGKYPVSLLETVVRRVKTDKLITEVRAGIIKACINRNFAKEEFDVSLNQENREPAYLCGRLFAVLEKLQQDASNNSLNRTIKDAYFGSACSNPAIVFPKLLRLAQNHLKKVKNPVFYNIQIGEIMDKLPGSFPNSLPLVKQGTFVIGYYQQYQSFFVKKEKSENKETEE